MKEEESLPLFIGIQKMEEEGTDLLSENTQECVALAEAKPHIPPESGIVSSPPAREIHRDDFWNSENKKTVCDWLLTPPKARSSSPSVETESQKASMGHAAKAKACPVPLNTLNSSKKGKRRSSSVGRPASNTSGPANPKSLISKSSTSSATGPSTKSSAPVSKPATKSKARNQTVKLRPWNAYEMSGFSVEAPPNLRTSLSVRPASASKGRPSATKTETSSSATAGSNGLRLQRSCSSSRGRPRSKPSIRAVNFDHLDGDENVSPVVMGMKMVERLVNSRKLAPSKQEDDSSKSVASSKSLGFGRTLSKVSLDMALRHMDITQSTASNSLPLMTKIPASSKYGVKLGQMTYRTDDV